MKKNLKTKLVLAMVLCFLMNLSTVTAFAAKNTQIHGFNEAVEVSNKEEVSIFVGETEYKGSVSGFSGAGLIGLNLFGKKREEE